MSYILAYSKLLYTFKKGFRNRISIVSIRQRLSRKSVKAYATIPIGVMGGKNLALPD